jgi:hypothetical protein
VPLIVTLTPPATTANQGDGRVLADSAGFGEFRKGHPARGVAGVMPTISLIVGQIH